MTLNKFSFKGKKSVLVEMDYSGIEERKCSGDRIPYLSKSVELTMLSNGEKLSTLEQLEHFHDHNWVYTGNTQVYMMQPASCQVENVKEMIQKSVTLWSKNLKLANDQWPSVNEVLDFRYFTVQEVIDYMERLLWEPQQAYNDLWRAYVKQKAELVTAIVESEKKVVEKEKEDKELEEQKKKDKSLPQQMFQGNRVQKTYVSSELTFQVVQPVWDYFLWWSK